MVSACVRRGDRDLPGPAAAPGMQVGSMPGGSGFPHEPLVPGPDAGFLLSPVRRMTCREEDAGRIDPAGR